MIELVADSVAQLGIYANMNLPPQEMRAIEDPSRHVCLMRQKRLAAQMGLKQRYDRTQHSATIVQIKKQIDFRVCKETYRCANYVTNEIAQLEAESATGKIHPRAFLLGFYFDLLIAHQMLLSFL